MNQTTSIPSRKNDQIRLYEIILLIRKRKIPFLVVFIVFWIAVNFFLRRSALPFHIQQNFIARHTLTEDDFQDFLGWRSEPLILNKIIDEVGDPQLSEHLLSTRMLSVRFRQLPVFQTKEGAISERYQIGLFVRATDEGRGRDILSVWTRLCLEQVEKRNDTTRYQLNVRENQLREMETFINRIGDELYFGLEQNSIKKSKVLELMEANNDLEKTLKKLQDELDAKKQVPNGEWMYLKGQLDAYANFYDRLSFLRDKARLSQTVLEREKEIRELRSKIIEIEVAGGPVVILNKKDNHLQSYVLAPPISLAIALFAISCWEIAGRHPASK